MTSSVLTKTESVIQTHPHSTAMTAGQLSDVTVRTMQSASRYISNGQQTSKTVDAEFIKNSVSSTELVTSSTSPTSSTDIYEDFSKSLKNADPKKKSSLQLVSNLTNSLIEEATSNNGESLLEAFRGFEGFAFKYAKNHLNDTETMTVALGELVLQIQKIKPGRKTNVTIPQLNDTGNSPFMIVPPGTFGNESAYLVAVVYKDVKPLLRQTSGDKLKVNSDIIALSAETKEKKSLKKKVKIIFKHPKDEISTKGPACVFWRFHRFDEGGKWSKTGCSVSSWNSSDTECSCDHLTHFAVLMPVQEQIQIPEADKMALTIITYFGLALSMIAEILTLVAFFLFSDITDPRSQVRVNLTCALLAGQLVFLAGIRAVSNQALCTAVALLLQCFYMASFCWMSVEAFLLYVHIVRVFSDFELKLVWLYGFSWGFPAWMMINTLVVALTEGEHMPALIREDYCWLSPKHGMSWTFSGVIASLIAANFFVLISVLREVSNLQGAPASKTESTSKAAKTATLLCPLLGVTWMVGFLNFSGTLLISEYLFSILNSLQGFLIFVLHTLRSTEIRKKALRKMRQWCPKKLNNNNKKARKRNKVQDGPQRSSNLAWAEKTTQHRILSSTESQSSIISQLDYQQ